LVLEQHQLSLSVVHFDRMGAPRSRFAAQFVTLLQLQTCCYLQAVPAEEDSEYNPGPKPESGSGKTKKSGSEKGSGKSICQESGIVKNRELHEQESYCRQIAVISRDNSSKDFELIKSDIRRNGHYDMKRRNVLDGKSRRPVKRPTTSSKIGENFYGR
jgi:hypothetical protein